MNKKNNNINLINVEKELKISYLNYAMSVIIGRALPDVRDGLKPVHRRILYAMYILKNNFNKSYKKSARIVGDVIGKYHPHGDNAVYDSIVRMAQNFSLRYPLIDGQGNFGSIDGDSAAAMRYTEIRMSKISEEFLNDIEKNTVNFLNNYDNTEKIPEILPTKIPNILINGSTGIAVGMATNIPPHNITELINTLLVYLNNKKISTKYLMKYLKGPDFPTGGIIENNIGIYKAYKTGKGIIKIKAKIKIEKNKKNNKKNIVIYELPYQINKSKIIKKIANLIKEKKIENIYNIRDESDKDGMRIVIEIKKDSNPKLIINKLLYFTNLKISYSINIVALYKGKPQILNLKKILNIFIKHRKKIIKNKTLFQLNIKKKKLNIYEGLLITLNNIDKIINIIKSYKNINLIKKNILNKKWKINKYLKIKNNKNNIYIMNSLQVNSLLNLNLIKISKIEQNKIKNKYFLLIKEIKKLKEILINKKKLINIIKSELIYIKKNFGDKRITKIKEKEKKINIKDLIKKENIFIILTYLNYICYQKISIYEVQHKKGKGKNILKDKNNDYIQNILYTNTHKKIYLFSNKGKYFKINSYELPIKKKKYKGKPIINFIKIKKKEKINFLLEEEKNKNFNNIILITKKGIIKKIKINKLKENNKKGLNIIKIKKNDELINAIFIKKNQEIIIFTKLGKALRFSENKIRKTNRNSFGIKGIKLLNNDNIVSIIRLSKKDYKKEVTIITEKGYGKRTLINEFPIKSRGNKGILSIKINNKNGNIIKVIKTKKNDELIIITNKGNLIRIKNKEINLLKRNTQGIIIMKINKKNEKISDIERISL